MIWLVAESRIVAAVIEQMMKMKTQAAVIERMTRMKTRAAVKTLFAEAAPGVPIVLGVPR